MNHATCNIYLVCSVIYLEFFTVLEILKDLNFNSQNRLLLHYSIDYNNILVKTEFFIICLVTFHHDIHLPVILLSGSSLSKKVNLTYVIWLCLTSAHQIHRALFPATTDNNSNANNDADNNHAHSDENPNPKLEWRLCSSYATVDRSILSSAEVHQVLDIYTVGYRLSLA
ncbi:hypothetical protein T11_7098 [Trichinella zimbabwensis]|uniref:Uncharacterized protein n=1 Tax=Trichinella zimbabwensis TaxID=268475 RepID=A0A0V1I127_9BILA|nr:hypothetical protein T11_7098 [Trichinella zimbabwensis]